MIRNIEMKRGYEVTERTVYYPDQTIFKQRSKPQHYSFGDIDELNAYLTKFSETYEDREDVRMYDLLDHSTKGNRTNLTFVNNLHPDSEAAIRSRRMGVRPKHSNLEVTIEEVLKIDVSE